MNHQKALISIELTNRCNLNCYHCFSGRHGGRHDLPLSVLQEVLDNARSHGFDLISFTGGDPTVYRHFDEALARTVGAGYPFGFNTNGWNFVQIYQMLLPYRDQLRIITFSLDGATEVTHDRLRGKGSFRRVLQAMSLCVVHDLPFSINMVVTAHNRHELQAACNLAERLGSRSLRFGHLLHSPLTTDLGFDLSPKERMAVDQEVQQLRTTAAMPVHMGAGYHTTELFPCRALHLQELNVDCFGNLTKCCHLSNHGGAAGTTDIIGNLQSLSFAQAFAQLQVENEQFYRNKRARSATDVMRDSDYYPCWYCFNYYNKVGWLAQKPQNSWQPLLWERASDSVEAEFATADATLR